MTASTSTAVIRQWARDNGVTVGERGRLSPQVLAAYASTKPPFGQAPRAAAVTAARPAGRAPGALAVHVRPTPGATGIGHRIVARSA